VIKVMVDFQVLMAKQVKRVMMVLVELLVLVLLMELLVRPAT
jgi:hypothetical protein